MKKKIFVLVLIIIILLITNVITATLMFKYKNNAATMDSNRPNGEFNRTKPTGTPPDGFKGGKNDSTTDNNTTTDSTTTE